MKYNSLKNHRVLIIFINALVIVSVGLSFYYLNFAGEITGFFKIGDVLSISPYLDRNEVKINNDQVGYDGQFFLTLALDPFLTNPETVDALDNPKYRIGRLLYPLTGYLLSCGNREIIPYTLVILNGLFILLMVGMLSKNYKLDAIDVKYSFLLLCIPGLWITFSFSTAELMSSFLLVASYSACKHKKFVIAGIFASLACLAKEVVIIFWLSCLISVILDKNRKLLLSLLLSIIPFLLFRTYLF
ncbi:hypothetical protein K8T06_06785, partial [bacterium]|nr:hypothetical protein [bacterium]